MSTVKTMRAQVLESFNKPYTLHTTFPAPPSPLGQDILVKVNAASYCHTDAVFAAGDMQQVLPRIGSHEFAGEIVALGPDVKSSLNLKQGTAVGCPGRAYQPCGKCYECRNNDGDPEGYGVWCSKAGNLGLTRDGGFQEYCLVDSRQCAPIPEPLTAVETAPLMCAGVTIWTALGRAGVDITRPDGGKGHKVVISGAGGGLGHLGVQFAAKLGAEVIAVDAGDRPLALVKEVAEKMGVMDKVTIIDARKVSVLEARTMISGPIGDSPEQEKGADSVLVLPEAQVAFDYGIGLVRNHGTCVSVSFPREGWKVDSKDLVFRDIKVVGTLVGRNRQLRDMLNFAARNGVRASTRTYRLEQLNELVKDYHKGAGGKLVIDMKK